MADRFDLDAIDADDALLDLLAAGGESARFAGANDPAVALLAELRLAVEVEDELPVETIDDPESFLARCAALNPVTDPFARKMAARGLALGVAAVAALSVSGVAAAVNGNPLSPYEKVIEKITEAVTPSTDFPKEQLGGLPVVDKAKIVKVSKDFQKKQEQKAAEAKTQQDQTLANGEMPAAHVDPTPPLARVNLPAKPTVIEQPLPTTPTEPTTPTQPTDPEPGDPTTKPSEPTPTDPPATEPTTPTETPPPSTTPTDPPSTTPSDPPSSPPPTNNGETGTGSNPSSSDPTTVPSGNPSENPGSDNTGETGDGKPTGEVQPSTPPSTPPLGDQQPGDTGQSGDTQTGDTQTGDNQTGDSKPVDEGAELIKAIAPILPTPTGAPADVPSAVQFFGQGLELNGKHSNGKVSTGSVRATYTKGKHSTGAYPEGKHAAIERTHGSLDDETVLRILGVLNKRTS
ncbi:hypothetical protein ACIA49_10635 [Kribbella sp. NPDC051587]|uniref:hypothetical protein n=1 Tax=Kribbella sp. NPDC051587 TaxID=3364119 RepID=UPI0037BCE0D5